MRPVGAELFHLYRRMGGRMDGRTHKDDEFLISNFRRALNVVFFLLGDFPASEFYMPTFRKIQTPGNHQKVRIQRWRS